jgi:hypothetical protein
LAQWQDRAAIGRAGERSPPRGLQPHGAEALQARTVCPIRRTSVGLCGLDRVVRRWPLCGPLSGGESCFFERLHLESVSVG